MLAMSYSAFAAAKPKQFEAALHWDYATPLVVPDDIGAPLCANNPLFCEPATFLDEARAWRR